MQEYKTPAGRSTAELTFKKSRFIATVVPVCTEQQAADFFTQGSENMEEKISLNGIIDMHVHTAPDVCGRTYNDLELTAAAVRAGARAIVIKGHHCSTVARAALCNAYNRMAFDSNSFVMYGGLVLNYEAGGLNPKAVQTALEMGAKVIWLPTVDAENDCRKHGRSGGIRMTDDRGVSLPELRRIFTLIKEYK